MEKLTRRDFLKLAGAAAVGAAAYSVPGMNKIMAAGEGSVKVSAKAVQAAAPEYISAKISMRKH